MECQLRSASLHLLSTQENSHEKHIKTTTTTTGITWEAKKTNDEILQKVGGRQLPGILVKRMLWYFGHLMRKTDDNLEKDIITGNRCRGRPPRSWINDITDWTDMSMDKILQMVWDREYYTVSQKKCASVIF